MPILSASDNFESIISSLNKIEEPSDTYLGELAKYNKENNSSSTHKDDYQPDSLRKAQDSINNPENFTLLMVILFLIVKIYLVLNYA